ncbi:hypothetical protein [Nocardioides sp. YIM 152315]|uniref:hypothetical protein n=1 Tax=Nocardioides sp. YIM 152315 TaxID=3031760 RepID=UPI0023DAA49C|nr:hypothetical protein [Nocardioides sp. YIM 152315]MDF1602813.1 hypothetical protein [Nocardioides sp. YIM 152315]
MSQPPPSYPTPSGYPPAPPPRPQKYRPSWAWFLVGGGLIVVGLAAGVALFIWTLAAFFTTDASVPADGQPHTVTVDTDGDRMLWRDEDVFDPGCRIVDTATGEEIRLRPVTSQFSRDTGDGDRVAAYRFDPGSGELEVTCTLQSDASGDPDWTMGWGKVEIGPAPSVGGFVGGLVATIAVPALFGLFGLATLIVTGVLWATRPARPKS